MTVRFNLRYVRPRLVQVRLLGNHFIGWLSSKVRWIAKTDDYKLSIDMNVSVNVCLSICVSPMIDWQPVQGVYYLSPSACWEPPASLNSMNGYREWMDAANIYSDFVPWHIFVLQDLEFEIKQWLWSSSADTQLIFEGVYIHIRWTS